MSLKKKTINGLFWSGFSQAGKQINQFVITIILARLLSPSDFGLLAMATIFINFGMVFSEMGISSALIQKQDAHDRHYYSAFWFNVIIGIALTLIFIAVSPLIAWFYKKPELVPILAVISFNFFLSSFAIIQQAILTKEMDFRKLAIRDVAAVIIAGVVGVVLAYNGFGVWSLVFQSVIFTLANVILLWTVSSWRPKLAFAMQDIKDIFHFSANLTGFNIVNYFARNIDQLLIGKFLGAKPLGYYSLAYKIMLFPLQNVSDIVSRVIFPVFARIQNELNKISSSYIVIVRKISIISVPLMLVLFIFAPEIVSLIFGIKWKPSIGIIRIFCICGMIQSIGGNLVGNLRLALGASSLHFKLGLVNSFCVIIVTLIGLKWGVYGVALCYTAYSAIWFFYTNQISLKLVNLNTITLIKNLRNTFIISLWLLAIALILKVLILYYPSLIFLAPVIIMLIYIYLLLMLKEIYFKNNKLHLSDAKIYV